MLSFLFLQYCFKVAQGSLKRTFWHNSPTIYPTQNKSILFSSLELFGKQGEISFFLFEGWLNWNSKIWCGNGEEYKFWLKLHWIKDKSRLAFGTIKYGRLIQICVQAQLQWLCVFCSNNSIGSIGGCEKM